MDISTIGANLHDSQKDRGVFGSRRMRDLDPPQAGMNRLSFWTFFILFLSPLPREVRRRVRTAICLSKSEVLGRFRPGSEWKPSFYFDFGLLVYISSRAPVACSHHPTPAQYMPEAVGVLCLGATVAPDPRICFGSSCSQSHSLAALACHRLASAPDSLRRGLG